MGKVITIRPSAASPPSVRLSERLIECDKLADVFRTTLKFIHDEFGLDSGIFMLTGRRGEQLPVLASFMECRGGTVKPVRRGFVRVDEEGVAVAYAFREAKAGRTNLIYFPDIKGEEISNRGYFKYNKAAFMPLLYHGEPIGVLWADKQGDEIPPASLRRMSWLQNVIGISIRHAEAVRIGRVLGEEKVVLQRLTLWAQDHFRNSSLALEATIKHMHGAEEIERAAREIATTQATNSELLIWAGDIISGTPPYNFQSVDLGVSSHQK
jgi:hypothetical protein